MSQQDQIHQAFQRIIQEATPSTPSGSHKVFVVGQLIVNVQEERDASPSSKPGRARRCCGKCHN